MAEPVTPAGLLRVTVAYSPAPRELREWAVELPAGSTVADALDRSGVFEAYPQLRQRVDVGVWGRPATLQQPLAERDRVELYRPLLVDPKVARRERFRRQGARTAGLFASRKPDGA